MKGKGILDRRNGQNSSKAGEKGSYWAQSIQPNFPEISVHNGSVRSIRKSFEKTGPPFEVVLFSRLDRLAFWLNGSRPLSTVLLSHLTGDT